MNSWSCFIRAKVHGMEERRFTIHNLKFTNLMTLAYCLCVVLTLWCEGFFSSLVINGRRVWLRGPRVRFLQSAVLYKMPCLYKPGANFWHAE